MTIDLVFVGFGGHATVVADAARARGGLSIVGYTDRQPSSLPSSRDVPPFLGTDEAFLDRFVTPDDVAFVLGLAGTRVSDMRQRLAARYEDRGARFVAIVHPSASVSPLAIVEPGAVILAGAIVNAGARVGRHAVVNSGAIVEHDVDVGPFVSLAPAVVVGGGTAIGEGAYLGLGARIRDHVRIGRRATVAMGGVVVSDVPDDVTVVGLPAKPRSYR